MALLQQFETSGAEGVKTSKVTCCGRREISSDVVCMLERTDRAAVVWVHKVIHSTFGHCIAAEKLMRPNLLCVRGMTNVWVLFELDRSRDGREFIFQSHSLPFPMVHSHSSSSSQAQPGFISMFVSVPLTIPTYSQCQSHIY